MSQVFRLPRELNLLLSCFGLSALHSRILLKQLTQPTGLASLNCVRQGSVRFNLKKTRQPPPFTHLAVLFIYGAQVCAITVNCKLRLLKVMVSKRFIYDCYKYGDVTFSAGTPDTTCLAIVFCIRHAQAAHNFVSEAISLRPS